MFALSKFFLAHIKSFAVWLVWTKWFYCQDWLENSDVLQSLWGKKDKKVPFFQRLQSLAYRWLWCPVLALHILQLHFTSFSIFPSVLWKACNKRSVGMGGRHLKEIPFERALGVMEDVLMVWQQTLFVQWKRNTFSWPENLKEEHFGCIFLH